MTIVPRNLLTHDATITGERQTGTEDDGHGGTQPVFETVTLETSGRYEPDGQGISRTFLGEVAHDGPVFMADGRDVLEWDDDVDVEGQVAPAPGDSVTLDGIAAEYEVDAVDAHQLGSGDPELVVLRLQEPD